MKNLLMITGSILFICIIITSMFSNSKTGAAVQEEPKAAVSQSAEESSRKTSVKEEKTGYTLKEYEKKIAAFENAKSEPIYISDVYVNDLPKTDRELLKEGIYAEDKKALKRLIEDYCS